MASATSTPPPAGVVDSIRWFLASWVAVLKTRVELVSTEIEEQREWIERIMLLALGSFFCLSLGLILLTLVVVMIFWETGRLWVLGGFALLYLAGGAVLWISLRRLLKHKPRIFAETAAELGKDYHALRPRSPE